jgi:hypothetical protein
MGTLIEGDSPIYVGDIIYFSASGAVGWNFERLLSAIGNVDSMGEASLFLSFEFAWLRHIV